MYLAAPDPFHANLPFPYPMKKLENLWYFEGYRNETHNIRLIYWFIQSL